MQWEFSHGNLFMMGPDLVSDPAIWDMGMELRMVDDQGDHKSEI